MPKTNLPKITSPTSPTSPGYVEKGGKRWKKAEKMALMKPKNHCKRGCHWPTYEATDRWGDTWVYCLGCGKLVENCDCRKQRLSKNVIHRPEPDTMGGGPKPRKGKI